LKLELRAISAVLVLSGAAAGGRGGKRPVSVIFVRALARASKRK